jgi:catechol 2,3-dioxygenase-like lactoylglutathione lyase family enzyme
MIVIPVSTLPKLHHVMIAIPAASEATARAFYGDILGLTEISKPDSLAGRGGLWLSTGTLDVHLGVDQDFHPARKAHLALEFDELEPVRDRLARQGYTVGPIECELPGYVRFYVSDPFGNRLELMQSR